MGTIDMVKQNLTYESWFNSSLFQLEGSIRALTPYWGIVVIYCGLCMMGMSRHLLMQPRLTVNLKESLEYPSFFWIRSRLFWYAIQLQSVAMFHAEICFKTGTKFSGKFWPHKFEESKFGICLSNLRETKTKTTLLYLSEIFLFMCIR